LPYVKTVQLCLRAVKGMTWCRPLAPIGRAVFDRYHAKVLSVEDTRKIFALNEDVRLVSEKNKRAIPYRYATRIIFQEPEFIVVMDCPCKKASGRCEPLQSCIAVGKDLATFWLDHCRKYHPRKITQAEALEIIRSFRKTGHVTQAFFKVATGGSTGVICNCCPDCCVSLQATRITKRMDPALSMTALSGYSVSFDPEKCTRCNACTEICPVSALSFAGEDRLYDRRACLGCELCVEHCPAAALRLYVDPEKPCPLDLDRLRREASA
jgi:Fe-S-cluster-containing hydrogenase component 2